MDVNVEEIVRIQVAQKIIETMPEEERKKILEASLTKTLQDALRPWAVENAIREDVNKYMAEYIKQSEVQQRIKKATEKNVDKLMEGVIYTIIENSQNAIKSEYEKFIKKQNISESSKKSELTEEMW